MMLNKSFWPRLLVVVIGTVVIGMLTSCSGGGGGSESNKDSTVTPKAGSTVDATVGKQFVIKLESNPTTGYAWSVKKTPTGVKFISSNYEAPKKNKAGAPGEQLLRFEPTAAGTGDIDLVYERPFAPDEPGKSLTFSVDASKA